MNRPKATPLSHSQVRSDGPFSVLNKTRFSASVRTAVNWPGDAVDLEVDLQFGKSQNLLVVDCEVLEHQHGARRDKTEAKVDQR